METRDEKARAIKGFILERFLLDEDPSALTGDVPLITSGVIDSVGTLALVAFLEDRFKIRIEAHETDVEFLNTVGDMLALIERKERGA